MVDEGCGRIYKTICEIHLIFAYYSLVSQDDAVARVASLERQLSELQEVHQKSEARLRDVTRTLSELEERKRYADDKLNKAVSQSSQQVWECCTEPLQRKQCVNTIWFIFHLFFSLVTWYLPSELLYWWVREIKTLMITNDCIYCDPPGIFFYSTKFHLQEDSLRRKESEIRSLNEELSNTRRKMSDLEQERSTLNVSVFQWLDQTLVTETSSLTTHPTKLLVRKSHGQFDE